MNDPLDFLKVLSPNPLDRFPRKIMTSASAGQIEIYDEDQFLENLKLADFKDCYVATHSPQDLKNGKIRVVFIDVDLPGNLPRALKLKDRILAKLFDFYGVKAHSQFSGFKGYHVIIPLKDSYLIPDNAAKDFLKFLQLKLSLGYCDPQILGDLVRLVRIPFTYNTKNTSNGLVTPLDEWDGRGLEPSLLWAEFRLLQKEERRKKAKTRHEPCGNLPESLRPQILVLVDRAKSGVNLTNRQRLAVLCEAINNGLDDKQIHHLFAHIPDYEESITQYQIDSARAKRYLPFKSANLASIMEA